MGTWLGYGEAGVGRDEARNDFEDETKFRVRPGWVGEAGREKGGELYAPLDSPSSMLYELNVMSRWSLLNLLKRRRLINRIRFRSRCAKNARTRRMKI